MWTKIMQSILIPIIQKALTGIYDWVVNYFKERKRKKKLKKENKDKVDTFKAAETLEDIGDAFDDLP